MKIGRYKLGLMAKLYLGVVLALLCVIVFGHYRNPTLEEWAERVLVWWWLLWLIGWIVRREINEFKIDRIRKLVRQASDWTMLLDAEICPFCRYSLYKNDSGVCPECGINGRQRVHEIEFMIRLRRARMGDPGSMAAVGYLYLVGQGTTLDYLSGMYWCVKAAEHDIPIAVFNVAELHERGIGVPENFKEAMSWYLRAADLGFHSAFLSIGRFYERGLGVAVDRAAARQWYEKAAHLPEAQESLARLDAMNPATDQPAS